MDVKACPPELAVLDSVATVFLVLAAVGVLVCAAAYVVASLQPPEHDDRARAARRVGLVAGLVGVGSSLLTWLLYAPWC